MVNLPTFRTEETHTLNLEIAKKSHGVAFVMLSGKDSLVAYLNMKNYFSRVIPFHCSSFPGSKHIKDTLDYYEDMIGDHIVRMVGEEVPMAVARGMYQFPDSIPEIEQMDVPDFNKIDILEQLRYHFNLPRAWCGVGLNIYDSIDRRIYLNKYKGKNDSHLCFYSCYDWPKIEIINALQQSGLKLSSEYKYTSRSMGGVPSTTNFSILRDHYPEDYDLMLSIYPLAEAKIIRERYLDRKWEERRAAGIVSDDGGVSSQDGEYETDDGTDDIPELGIDGSQQDSNGGGK